MYTHFEILFLSNEMRQKYNFCCVIPLTSFNPHMFKMFTFCLGVFPKSRGLVGFKSGDRGRNSVALPFHRIHLWMCTQENSSHWHESASLVGSKTNFHSQRDHYDVESSFSTFAGKSNPSDSLFEEVWPN
jgi:hypothetical protein